MPSSAPRARHLALPIALVLTGAAALVYQVAWGRMLRGVFGVGDLANAAVLAAYFLGLGFGALAGGRIARRVRRPAFAYAALELFVGGYALASLGMVPAIRDAYLSIARDASFEVVSLVRLALALVVLLPPTLAMGATLPVALAAATGDDSEGSWAPHAAILYALNTLGAMAGAAAAGFWLVPAIGIHLSVVAAAAGSAGGATLVFVAWRSAVAPAPPPAAEQAPGRPGLAAVLVAMGGFVSLASEVLWTRVLGLVVHGTTQAFAAMLATFLCGIALGGALAGRLLRTMTRHALAYALTQLGVALGIVWAMVAIAQVPRAIGLLTGSQDLVPSETWVLFVVSIGTLLPMAICIGATVPIAWRLATGGIGAMPRAAARVLAFNTIGGLSGALAAALLLIPSFGIDLTAIVLVAVCLLATAIAARADLARPQLLRAVALVGPTAVYALVLVAEPSLHLEYLLRARDMPVPAVFGGPSSGTWAEPIVFLREGRNATVMVQRIGSRSLQLLNDGRPESGISVVEPGFGVELVLLGTLPTLRAARTERAAVVGLGAGHVVTTLLAGGWNRVDAIELEGSVVDAARLMHKALGRPFPLDDRRANTIVDDGRARIAAAPPGRYDAIVSQPSHPWLAGSSVLYTREFFADVARALRRGGVFVLWVNRFRMDLGHLRQIVATVSRTFADVEGFGTPNDLVLVAAKTRERIADRVVARRLGAAAPLQRILERAGVSPVEELLAFRDLDRKAALRFGRGATSITDDRPSLEYDLSHLPMGAWVDLAELDRSLRGVGWTPPPGEPETRTRAYLARIDGVRSRPGALERIELGLRGAGLPAGLDGLVRGALAEARGDAAGAIAHWARSDEPEALVRRARLLSEEGRDAEALEAAESPPNAPAEASFAGALAAVRLGRWQEAARLFDRAAPALETETRRTAEAGARLGRARAGGGCGDPLDEEPLRGDPDLLWSAAVCALDSGDFARGQRLAALADVARRSRAVVLADLGVELARGRNDRAAMRALRLALRHNPAHGAAASALAQLVARRPSGKEDARRILETALQAAKGLPRTVDQLLGTAERLEIPISHDFASSIDREATSTAGPATMGGPGD